MSQGLSASSVWRRASTSEGPFEEDKGAEPNLAFRMNEAVISFSTASGSGWTTIEVRLNKDDYKVLIGAMLDSLTD